MIAPIVLAAVSAVASPAPAAGALRSVTALECRVGDTWTFAYTSKIKNGKGLNGSETWTRTTCGDRGVRHPSGRLLNADVVDAPDGSEFSGYAALTGDAIRYKTPLAAKRLPIAAGATWDGPVDMQIGDRNLTGTMHANVVGWESVTVPAGTFECLRIETKSDVSYTTTSMTTRHMRTVDTTIAQTLWYSPDARIDVKATITESNGDTGTRELLSKTP